MRIVSCTVFVVISCFNLRTVQAIPDVDVRYEMERTFNDGLQFGVPPTRPLWFEITRTSIGTDGWFLRTAPDRFTVPGFLRGTTIGFYDNFGVLLHQNREASASYLGSYIGFGIDFSPVFGVGSPVMPDVNRPYYLGVGGVDTEFFSNFAFNRGNDQGMFVAAIAPTPGPAATLAAAALFAARRRRRTNCTA